jgi:hypothetical protein
MVVKLNVFVSTPLQKSHQRKAFRCCYNNLTEIFSLESGDEFRRKEPEFKAEENET